MNVKLKKLIKNLSSGYSFRGKIKHDNNGFVRVIQLKDFKDNYTSLGSDYTLIADEGKEKHYLNDKDVLFIAKGANNFAITFNKYDDIPTIASSALYRLEVDKSKIIPEYLTWYINQKKMQNYLKARVEGTYTTSVNRSVLMDMPIEVPPLTIQHKLASMIALHQTELTLIEQIEDLKNKLRTEQFLKIVENDN